ncbi:hypothetical protein BS47DRAFT_1315622 [Hydnum rufescens UP504]|uniref:ERT1/acuK family PAS domain-containing protein n=1 Tax=Hydnum rufescens UP504 TaxID=1448309 RepID=A0A9P6B1L3_9AGAM|nr:hypothetical protein BS47DRAFT_1315622 [Hydnum rufescens UP504]
MTCDEGRPCQRCIKRDIGHLCHDEPKPPKPQAADSTQLRRDDPLIPTPDPSMLPLPQVSPQFTFPPTDPSGASTWPLLFPQETLGNEFSVLSDFLESLEDQTFFNGGNNFSPFSNSANPVLSNSLQGQPFPQPDGPLNHSQFPEQTPRPAHESACSITATSVADQAQAQQQQTPHAEHIEVLPAANKTERFLLTAADQEGGTRDERLARVIQAKYEAGLLKPFNYVKGYARLSRWMEQNVSPQSKQQILQPLSVLRPKFRAIAQSLTDIDLVFIEEAFERLLLEYDRVFSAMAIPACLWRRTGEIYKGNKEFADLVGVDVMRLRDGRLCIYELMSEESAVNYWEKYGHVAFDTAQKAVLTSCVLRYKPSALLSGPSSGTAAINSGSSGSVPTTSPASTNKKRKKEGALSQDGFINCCFSFTIQRDLHGIPTLIAGNFIRH